MGSSIALIAPALLATAASIAAVQGERALPACVSRAVGTVAVLQSSQPEANDASTAPNAAPAWRSFELRSTLVYTAAPKRPHRLIATYVYPDRARWWLEAGDANHIERVVQYRSGEHAYDIGKQSSTSQELASEACAALFGQMELRRALALWPDGISWRGEGLERTASLGELGTLWCRFVPGAESAPTEIGLRDAAGAESSAFRAVTWRVKDGRPRAATAEFHNAGELLWNETLDSTQSPIAFIDAFFLPPDRRPEIPSELDTGKIEHVDLPEFWGQRIPLAKGLTWEQALAENQRLRAETAERLAPSGMELDRMVTIEVSNDLVPRACVLRLTKEPEAPPSEFTRTRTRTGVIMIVAGFAQLTPTRLQALTRARADAVRGGAMQAAYVRFAPDQAPKGAVLLVLPVGES